VFEFSHSGGVSVFGNGNVVVTPVLKPTALYPYLYGCGQFLYPIVAPVDISEFGFTHRRRDKK